MIWQGLRLVASSLLGPVLDLVLVDVAALGVVLELVAALGVVFAWGVAAAQASNASGRHRTLDHLLPLQPADEARPKPKGRGAWKQWTPEAILRAAFGEATATVRQAAREVDGASAAHVIKARMFIGKCLLDCQAKHIQSEINRLRERGLLLYHIVNLMFDETELDVSLKQVGSASWSVLASHSQLSICAAGQNVEIDIARPPRALPRKTAECMWGALCLDQGGLGPVLSENLVIMDAEPPGLQAEWAAARRQAKEFLNTMLQCEDEKAVAKRSRTRFVDDFVAFFPGPWRGQLGQSRAGGDCW
ncbi:Uncharacterized protein (Fragment) [Durusdinium trenchii]|uniref:Uncharacterized protein n=1 Tax=Durusdinium trenchii TaxID=1381693 RepID=A0ABP0Q978_9DINO